MPVGTKVDLSKYENCEESIADGSVVITKEENNEFYRYLTDSIYSLGFYSEMPGNQSAKFGTNESYASFCLLPVLKQIRLLNTMIILLNCTSVQGNDISILNPTYPKSIGIIQINKKLPFGARLIAQSYTGFYETVLFEVKE